MSTFSIENFHAEVRTRGMSRANRFEVLITAPACVKNSSDRLVSLYCDQASLPQTRIRTSQQQIFGPPSFHPQNAEYGGDNISFQFYLDADMQIKRFFDSWMDGIVNRRTGEVYFQDNYLCQGLTVAQLNQRDQETYKIKFEDLFPISVAPIQLDHGSNTVNRLNVTFTYRRWYEVDITSPVTPAPSKSTPQAKTNTASSDKATSEYYKTHGYGGKR